MSYTPPWTDGEVERLRRYWPEYRARRMTARQAAALVGRTVQACRQRATDCKIPLRSFRSLAPKVAELARARCTVREICLKLGVNDNLVRRAFRLLGIRSYYQSGTPQWLERSSRGVLVAARNNGTHPGRLAADSRMRRYHACGYPFGVRSRLQALAVDLARRRGGVSLSELPKSPSGSWASACVAVRYLCSVGVLRRQSAAACVVNRQHSVVDVFRLATDYPKKGPDDDTETDL
jgi:hypothetical protein